MHATEGPRRVRTWPKITVLAALTLLASSIATGSAVAATPNWSMDTVVSLPSAVTPGEAAGYLVTIRNDGPSNIAQLYLTAYAGTSDDPAPNPVFTSTTAGSCPNTGGTLYCTLGNLSSGASVSVTVAFTTPTDATSFSIRFEANTTGATSSDGGTSHGDTIEGVGTTTLSDDPDFGGRFVTTGNPTVANGLALGPGNLQSAKVHAPAVNIPVTVADGDQTTPITCPETCWSETLELNVGGGTSYPALFKVEIGVHKNLSETVHGFYHVFDAGQIPAAEDIVTKCPKNGTPTVPCFSVAKVGGGNILVTVWLEENGKGGLY
jgi:hypothetical protein